MSWSNRWEYIAATTLTGTAASVSFNPVPTDYRKFFVVGFIVSDASAKTVGVRFNNDSAANYSAQSLGAAAAALIGPRRITTTEIRVTDDTQIAASSVGLFALSISKPAAAEVCRTVSALSFDKTADAIAYNVVAGEWSNTAALISRIDFTTTGADNFAAGTKILLYGSRD